MLTVHCSHTAQVDPSSLKPNPLNPNRHSAHQIRLLGEIIKEQGWRNPITVSKRSGLIVRGHGRLEAALLIGCETVPIDSQDYQSDAAELADLLADNRLSELAELDEDGLKAVLEKIKASDPDFDSILTGFLQDDIDKLYAAGADDPLADIETLPEMECQAFEHHDYLVFIFRDLREWQQALKLIGAPMKVDYAIEKQSAGKFIGLGRVLSGKRLLAMAGAAST
jgi:hypothetical protein